MRIDKFLKVSRLIKRREIAKQLCDDQDVFLNDKPAKPSSEVNVGDTIRLHLGRHRIEAEILLILPVANKEQAATMYRIIGSTIME